MSEIDYIRIEKAEKIFLILATFTMSVVTILGIACLWTM